MIPITTVGKLGDNCKVEYVGQNNTPVIRMSVAVTIKKPGQDKQTIWLSCSWFGRVAESNYTDYLTKGREIFLSGEITSTNVGQNGKAYINVNIHNATLTSGTKLQGQQNQQPPQQQGYGQPQQQRQTAPQQQPPRNQDPLSDDLPF